MSETANASQLMPLAAMLGVQTVEATAEQVRLRLPWSAEVCTSGGVIHGGAIMALSDTAGALLAVLNLPPGAAGTTTTDSRTRFLGAVRAGHADAVSRVLHKGRTGSRSTPRSAIRVGGSWPGPRRLSWCSPPGIPKPRKAP